MAECRVIGGVSGKPLPHRDLSCSPAAASARQFWRALRVAWAARLLARGLLQRERVTAMDGSRPRATCYFPVFYSPVFSGRDCRSALHCRASDGSNSLDLVAFPAENRCPPPGSSPRAGFSGKSSRWHVSMKHPGIARFPNEPKARFRSIESTSPWSCPRLSDLSRASTSSRPCGVAKTWMAGTKSGHDAERDVVRFERETIVGKAAGDPNRGIDLPPHARLSTNKSTITSMPPLNSPGDGFCHDFAV
jgi:hypothetical protein